MKHPFFLGLTAFLGCFFVLTVPNALAEPQSFSEFLQEYNAIEVLNQELEDQPLSPDMILKRARLHLQMDKASQAISLLESHGTFSSPDTEARRLWLMAQGLRLQQEHVQALLHYSQAARLMKPKDMQEAFEAEPNLESYWENVSTLWIWNGAGQGRTSPGSGQVMIMIKALGQAQKVWPKNPFWRTATEHLSGGGQSRGPELQSLTSLSITDQTRLAIARGLSAAALEQPSRAQEALKGIDNPVVGKAWSMILDRLGIHAGTSQPSRADMAGYPKMIGFRDMILNRLGHSDLKTWVVSVPTSGAWQGFREQLAALPPREALSKISQELNSSLLSPESRQALVDFGLAYALLAQDREAAERLWDQHRDRIRPLALRLAAGILGLTPEADCPRTEARGDCPVMLLKILTSASGKEKVSGQELPFWMRLDPSSDLSELARRFPLDMLLNYAADHRRWTENKTPELARTVSLLFPGSKMANQGLFFLARSAHEESNPSLAWQYLRKIDPGSLSGRDREEYLLAKAGLEMELGRESESMQTYQTLLETAPQAIPQEKKLKLALLAQQQGDWNRAQSMLEELWESRQKLEPSVQAEVLFWLAEGSQKQGRQIQALRHYLRVFWDYPEEHIWAVTALYRAALIYEQRGDYRVARKMLSTVVDRADRKSQKEAARQRIKGIERRMAGSAARSDEPNFLF
jgi:tetratricopeptide (TPR) repeat protein